MATDIVKQREFMTSWHTSARPRLEAWSERNKANLMHSTTSTRHVPLFRAFDLLSSPRQALTLLQNEDHRIGVESLSGQQDTFFRYIDLDTVYFQFAGNTLIETEFGEYDMAPGDLLFVPEGISHRSTGSADSLRWFLRAFDSFTDFMTESDYTTESAFRVTRKGGPKSTVVGMPQPPRGGRVTERMISKYDGTNDETLAERDYEYLVGASSTDKAAKVSGIRKLRSFDLFKGIAGIKGGVEPIFKSPHLEVKTYNVMGEQYAFHRALRSEEVRIQFRGNAIDMSEIENVPMTPGDVTIVPRGIAHSVKTDPIDDTSFLRLVFYSDLPWRYPHDLTRHTCSTSFDVKTLGHKKL